MTSVQSSNDTKKPTIETTAEQATSVSDTTESTTTLSTVGLPAANHANLYDNYEDYYYDLPVEPVAFQERQRRQGKNMQGTVDLQEEARLERLLRKYKRFQNRMKLWEKAKPARHSVRGIVGSSARGVVKPLPKQLYDEHADYGSDYDDYYEDMLPELAASEDYELGDAEMKNLPSEVSSSMPPEKHGIAALHPDVVPVTQTTTNEPAGEKEKFQGLFGEQTELVAPERQQDHQNEQQLEDPVYESLKSVKGPSGDIRRRMYLANHGMAIPIRLPDTLKQKRIQKARQRLLQELPNDKESLLSIPGGLSDVVQRTHLDPKQTIGDDKLKPEKSESLPRALQHAQERLPFRRRFRIGKSKAPSKIVRGRYGLQTKFPVERPHDSNSKRTVQGASMKENNMLKTRAGRMPLLKKAPLVTKPTYSELKGKRYPLMNYPVFKRRGYERLRRDFLNHLQGQNLIESYLERLKDKVQDKGTIVDDLASYANSLVH